MSNYDFSTLNPTDFEKLVCDLLNKKVGGNSYGKFRTSKQGKDQGIDILYSTEESNFYIVVQVKHYAKSTFTTLKRELEQNEFSKVKKLNPQQYIFVTSLGLSVANKKEIMKIFNPYIKSIEDVLGKDDLNDLLRIYKEVEETHFKLWFSSTVALQKLLIYKYVGRNDEFSETTIKRKLRLFVCTPELERAISILQNNKFLIITGEPGVGKTTLSEMIIYKYLSKNYALTYIYDNIKDIEDTLRDDDSKQIFYFDDFLGHTQAEINKSKAAEISLIKIIGRIEKAENKYLILNTRKFILSTFLEESERFKNFNPLRAENKIEIGAYTYGAKRRMLDNHMLECQLSEGHINVLKNHAFFICTHSNFSPRHIYFYTNPIHISNLSFSQFEIFIRENLDNPKKIWEHAYCNQITDYEKLLLNTLYSLEGYISLDLLEKCYNARLAYEVKNNNFVKPLNSFKNSLQNLNSGFIEINPNYGETFVSFINPSLEDFLHHWIGENSLELERVLLSAINLSQWYYFFPPFVDSKHTITNSILNFFLENHGLLIGKRWRDEDLYKAAMLLFHFNKNDYQELVIKNLEQIQSWRFIDIESEIPFFSIKFLQAAKYERSITKTISNFELEFFTNSLLTATHIIEVVDMIDLFQSHYGFDFRKIVKHSENDIELSRIVKQINELCKETLTDLINLEHGYLLKNREADYHLGVIENIEYIKSFIRHHMFTKFKISHRILTQTDWNSLIETNITDEIVLGVKLPYEDADFEEIYDDEFEEYYDYQSEMDIAFKRMPPAEPFWLEEDFNDFPF